MSSIPSADQKLRGATLAKKRAEATLQDSNVSDQLSELFIIKQIADSTRQNFNGEEGKRKVRTTNQRFANERKKYYKCDLYKIILQIHRLDVDKLRKIKVCRYEFKVFGVKRNEREVLLSQPVQSE